ncbi:MAG: threonylcarbamoyl-AMP synthase [Methylophaga sp.]|nr:threonylcarbamoyl-AMP synthase [Methylophaga sp.]
MSNWRIRQAVTALNHGGVIAYPTEAVYGLGCDPWNVHAVKRLLDIKQRSWLKGLIIVAADFNQLQDFIAPVSAETLKELEATWPGPVTWLLPVNTNLPAYLSGFHDTIAVRVTAHKQTAELCREFGGAIVSTSANMAGAKPAKTIRQCRWNMAHIDAIVPGQCSGSTQPTEIRDAQTGERLR